MRILLAVLLLFLASPSDSRAEDEAKRLLALIDYIGGDYQNAVQGGKIVDADEYQEMVEFSARSMELFNRLKAGEGGDKAGVEKALRALASHIENRSGEDAVPGLAQAIKERLIESYRIVTHPKAIPDYETEGPFIFRIAPNVTAPAEPAMVRPLRP